MLREGVNAAELRKLGRLSVVIISMICLLLSSFIASLVQPAVAFASVVNEEDGAANGEEEAGNGADGAATDVNTERNPLALQLRSAILLEASTGQVLYEYNADEPWEPASMVKMMSEYLVLEAISQGKIAWDSVVTISPRASQIRGSGGLLAANHKYTVEDLFNQMSIYSSNDATVALAEFVATTEEAFVDMMNAKAREFGLSEHAHFSNATGLANEYYRELAPNTSGVNLFTARDSAIIALRLLEDHPEILEFSSKPQEYRRTGDTSTELYNNWNRMLESWIPLDNLYSKLYAYEGVDGLKTGHTDTAGYNFTATAERNGMRLISVVMDTADEDMRFGETRKLLDYGFNNFEKRTVIAAKTEMEQLPSVEITRGKATEVALVTETGIEIVMDKAHTNDMLEITAEPLPEEQLVAPIKQGDVLGTLTVKYGANVEQTINLIAAEDVEEAGWFTLLLRAIGNFFKNIWNSILNIF